MKQGSIQLAALYVEQASIQQTLQYRCVVVGSEHPEAVQVKTCMRERGSKNIHLPWPLRQKGPECSRCRQEQDAAK